MWISNGSSGPRTNITARKLDAYRAVAEHANQPPASHRTGSCRLPRYCRALRICVLAAAQYAFVFAHRRRAGRAFGMADAMIAAIARPTADLVTRNPCDLEACGLAWSTLAGSGKVPPVPRPARAFLKVTRPDRSVRGPSDLTGAKRVRVWRADVDHQRPAELPVPGGGGMDRNPVEIIAAVGQRRGLRFPFGERAMQVLRDRPAHLHELLMVMVMRVHEAGGEVCPRLCWLANGITAGLRPARQL
jgi:hypothetical protein